eukprot:TRINITY_DN1865_c1_g1_i2.p1 TRINITY_DN1865_c1_g1~~TRINITY_DN1865_c1_g1_i2.p1  ORF type:complete len:292 (-),score=37.16 TRINITY_DN1865_c1_g1_i2:91-966(-)
MLMAAAQQIFKAGGKKLRPVLVLLVSRATARLNHDYSEGQNLIPQQIQLAKIAEMIYTASQVHDEVLDEDDTRAVKQIKKPAFGTRLAVLAGDYLFAQSSWQLANLDNLEVIRMISQVIADYANGEITQEATLFQTEVNIEQYLQRSFYKTSSLIAASCRGAAAFNEVDEELKVAMYDFGKHLGFTMQIVDDILDLKSSGSDLQCGIISAPTVYSLTKSSELGTLIEKQFCGDGDFQRAQQIIQETGGIDYATELALQEGNVAKEALNMLPDCPEKYSLQSTIQYVLQQLS